MYKILTIAGSDSSGGAGIQADIKTITVHKMYAMSAITALTAQNTTGVYGILEVAPEFVGQQLDCIFTDIFPDAVKVGMVASAEIIKIIAAKPEQYQARHIVVDPVMVSTSGCKLIADSARETLIARLLPLAEVITPNIPETEVLCGFPVKNMADMEKAGRIIGANLPGAVLVKGGHLISDAVDMLYSQGTCHWFHSERIKNPNTHGTGCTLSSAIACNLAAGKSLPDSIRLAKVYLTGDLKAGLNLGQGAGPLEHTYIL